MDDPKDDSEEQLFRASLRPSELRALRGPCPSVDVLRAFKEGQLTAQERESIGNHIALCGLCELNVRQLHREEQPRTSVRTSLLHAIRSPILAYSLLAILCVPAYRGLVHNDKTQKVPAPGTQKAPALGATSARVFSIDRTRGTGAEATVHLAATEKFFILSFFAALKSPPASYELRITDSDRTISAEPLSADACNISGTCFIVCSQVAFPAGSYKAWVIEKGSEPGHERMFQFDVSLDYGTPTRTKGAQ